MGALTRERAIELFSYDPVSGVLKWRHRPLNSFKDQWVGRSWNTRYADKAVGAVGNNGYFKLTADRRTYLAHRIIWLMMYGDFPKGDIDHINGIRTDNRLVNLRAVDHVINQRNRGLNRNNTSGVSGVHFSSRTGRWCAFIGGGYSKKNLGEFDTKEAAIAARRQAEKNLGYHKNHGCRPSSELLSARL